MKTWLANLLGGGLVNIAQGAANIVDQFKLSDQEKAEFNLKMEELLQKSTSELEQSMRTELEAKERILVAELTQGDTYTKRARPTVVYAGLVFIALNYVVAPVVLWLVTQYRGYPVESFPTLTLPTDFWYAWGGVVATWSVGRTMERRGVKNNLVSIVTGSNPTAPSSGLLK